MKSLLDASDFLKKMSAIKKKHRHAIETYGKAAGNKMVKYAKKNAPWTDRTHQARNSIRSDTEWNDRNKLKINLISGEDYGIYLEYVNFKHKGRLSIWWPTVNKHKEEILKGYAEIIKK